VAGPVHPAGNILVISPTALVFEEDGRRTVVQPWVDRFTNPQQAAPLPPTEPNAAESAAVAQNPVTAYPSQLSDALGELLLLGLQRAREETARFWAELLRHGQAIGFDRFVRPIDRLVESLAARSRTLHWEARPAAEAVLETLVLARLAREEVGST
jgi:hypothetical protein